MMALDSDNEDADSEPQEPDSFNSENGDLDVYLNHYRISKLSNYANNSRSGCAGASSSISSREQIKFGDGGKILSLTELAAQKVACHLPFGEVEHFDPPVPEPMQCRIAFWSFPQDEEAIRLYTCLANGNADVFIRAEDLISRNCVCDMLQVGFHLSANVIQESTDVLDCFRVAITFDRRRITSCSCSCSATTFWCMHAVAVCLQRIRKPQEATLRAPVSESLQRLEKNQLQKFAQYLINELPQQILPAAQKLLDELLSGEDAIINKNPGAPDPTAGATINEQTSWCLDDTHLSMDIRKILLKQCSTQPIICSDPQSLDETPPPAAAEYSQLLRPIKGREPEGLWNLISIVGEMMKRRDSNYFLLLEIITEEVLLCEQIVIWWFETKVSLHSGSTFHCSYGQRKKEDKDKECTSQYTCSNFCDEIVHLWRLAALDPNSIQTERKKLYKKFVEWHLGIFKMLIDAKLLENTTVANRRNLLELFPGFKPAMEGCMIDWTDWDVKQSKIINKDATDERKESKSAQKRKRKKLKALKALAEAANKIDSSTNLDDHQGAISDNGNESFKEDKPSTSRSQEGCENSEPSQNKSMSRDISSDRNPLQDLNRNIPEQNVLDEPPRVEPDLQVYFMDRQADSPSREDQSESLEDIVRVNTRKLKDNLEILYAKTEGLHAHGYLDQSLDLALRVANEILNYPNYPSIKQVYTVHRRRRKKGSLDNQMSIVVSEAFSKISFLCNVLITKQDYHDLVFNLVLFAVELKRSPAATKPLEVKLINQKQDLIALLKTIALHENELRILRERAKEIRDGVLDQDAKSEALTTLIMGSYIFEALVLSKSPSCISSNQRSNVDSSRNGSTNSYNQSGQYQLEEHYLAPNDHNQPSSSHSSNDHNRQSCSLNVYGKLPTDINLGFHAALHAISVKANVSEIDHPLLCEGIRRQRGELVLSLLTHYKDDQEKLDLILKHFLDNDVVLALGPNDLPTNATSTSVSKLVRKTSCSNLSNQTGSLKGSTSDISEKPTKANSNQASNQPTEASAHFMFELAKTVFEKAGGNSMTAHLFRPQLVTHNASRGIHRRLHMCTLRIALYALGLQNRTSANWMDRNYSGRASFIHEQALEIGLPAIKFLSENWDGHLSPVEVVSIADKASCLDDAETKRVASEMAKSCLKYASNLDYHAVRRIFGHCEKQSIEMIEEACNEVEAVAENGNVCSDVLFATSRAWYGLYERLVFEDNHGHLNGCYLPRDDLPAAPEQDTGAHEWVVAAAPSSLHQDKQYNQYCEPNHWMHRDDYSRPEHNIPTLYLPTHKHIEYVKSSFRIGIKALDALRLTPMIGNKHNPKKEDDVIWLLNLCRSLDKSLEWSNNRECLHKFSQSVIKSITNPQILHIISTEFIVFFKNFPQDHADRVNILLPLIDKSLDRFVKQTRDLMKHISYDQKNVIETIMDQAQELTGAANTLTAFGYFKELLKIVDSKKTEDNRKTIENKRTKKSRSIYFETYVRHKWANDQLSLLKHCCCMFCRTGREISVNFMTGCNQCS